MSGTKRRGGQTTELAKDVSGDTPSKRQRSGLADENRSLDRGNNDHVQDERLTEVVSGLRDLVGSAKGNSLKVPKGEQVAVDAVVVETSTVLNGKEFPLHSKAVRDILSVVLGASDEPLTSAELLEKSDQIGYAKLSLAHVEDTLSVYGDSFRKIAGGKWESSTKGLRETRSRAQTDGARLVPATALKASGAIKRGLPSSKRAKGSVPGQTAIVDVGGLTIDELKGSLHGALDNLVSERNLTALLRQWAQRLQVENERMASSEGVAERLFYQGCGTSRKSFRQLFSESKVLEALVEKTFWVVVETSGRSGHGADVDSFVQELCSEYTEALVTLLTHCSPCPLNILQEMIVSFMSLCVQCRKVPTSAHPPTLEEMVKRLSGIIESFVGGDRDCANDIVQHQLSEHVSSLERAQFLSALIDSKAIQRLKVATNSNQKAAKKDDVVIDQAVVAEAFRDTILLHEYLEAIDAAVIAVIGLSLEPGHLQEDIETVKKQHGMMLEECGRFARDAEGKLEEIEASLRKITDERYERLLEVYKEKEKIVCDDHGTKESGFYAALVSALNEGKSKSPLKLDAPEDPFAEIQRRREMIVREYTPRLLELSKKAKGAQSKLSVKANIELLSSGFVSLSERCGQLFDEVAKHRTHVGEHMRELVEQFTQCYDAHARFAATVMDYCNYRIEYLNKEVLAALDRGYEHGMRMNEPEPGSLWVKVQEEVTLCEYYTQAIRTAQADSVGLKERITEAVTRHMASLSS